MGKKSKESTLDISDAVKSLFSADNPFRRKPEPAAAAAEPPAAATPEPRKRKSDSKREAANPNPSPTPESNPKKRSKLEESGNPKEEKSKRKRDELEAAYERRRYGEAPVIASEEVTEKAVPAAAAAAAVVVVKQKPADTAEKTNVVEESFDDESKLQRTVFVGNLPLKTKRKSLMKEFERFGDIESVRIRSVPIVDSKVPRKGAIIKGKINEAIDSVHAYVVFKDEESAHAAISHNMAEVDGNHIRVDMACPPRKKLIGEAPLYDRKRTLFVGNLPFDVKDEELYQLFCGPSQSESGVEAVRVIRDPHTSLGKGIAYVLFKTMEAANSTIRKKNMKIRDRLLRLSHAKSEATSSKTEEIGPKKDFMRKRIPSNSSEPSSERNYKPKASPPSYQGLRASKSGVLKKAGLRPPSSGNASHGSKKVASADQKVRQTRRPAVAARKAKLLKNHKQGSRTLENTHRNKKPRKH